MLRPDHPFLTHRQQLRYLHGHCHVFALALHQVTGWPLVVVWELDPEEDRRSVVHPVVAHIVCHRTPDRVHVDVTGPTTAARIEARYDIQLPTYGFVDTAALVLWQQRGHLRRYRQRELVGLREGIEKHRAFFERPLVRK